MKTEFSRRVIGEFTPKSSCSIVGTATALIGGAIIAGGVSSAISAKKAAKAQARGADQAIAEQRRQFDLNRADLAPGREAGTAALGRLGQLQSGDLSSFFTSPGFEFVREEGLRGIENRFSASSGTLSGNALRRLTEFNSGLASQEFGNFFNRDLALAGLGQNAVNTGVAAGTATSANISNALIGKGNARASGVLGVNSAIQGTLSNFLTAGRAGFFDPKPKVQIPT